MNDYGTKTLIIYAIAAHGSLMNGSQCILTDEFDSKINFYARFPAEQYIRRLAQNFPNSYHLGVFACSRFPE